MGLVSKYREYFRVQRADAPELVCEAQRLRYDVYCREFQFEDAGAHPDGLEKDEFDEFSRHCLLVHKPSGMYVGCVRLVLANPAQPHALFPFERHCGESLLRDRVDPAKFERESFGEISRLAIRRQFRRRRGEKPSPHGFSASLQPVREPERRQTPQMVLGLYLAAAAIGLSNGLDSVFAMMEPRLARHLSLTGIRFEQVGDVIDWRGPRAAFHITREGLYAHLKPEVHALLETITADLAVPSTEAQRRNVHAA